MTWLAITLVLAQPDAPIKRLPTPADAVRIALADAKTLNPLDAPYARYVYVPIRKGNEHHEDDARACSGCLHYLSRSNQVGLHTRPVPLAGGWVVRVDLRRYCRLRTYFTQDLEDWIRFWELFAFDPHFNTLITADMIKLATFSEDKIPTIKQHKTDWQWIPGPEEWRDEKGNVFKG